MDMMDEIDVAMKRGKSPYTALDLFRWLREGNAEIYIWPNMHASSVFIDDEVQIGHVYGTWTTEEAEELWERLLAFCKKNGKTGGKVFGRKGWQRFLKIKGFQT